MAVACHSLRDVIGQFIDDPIESIARFDAFVDDRGTLRFLEYNPGLCGEALNAYRDARLFLESEAAQNLARGAPLEAVPTPTYFTQAVVDAYRDHTGRDPAMVALVWHDDPPTETPREMAAFARALSALGIDFIMTAGVHVERRGNALWAGERLIDAAFVPDWKAMA